MKTTGTLALAAALAMPAVALAGAVQQNALHFAGDDDHVVLAALPPFVNDLAQDFTVTFWMRREALAAPGRVFFAQRDTTNFATFLLSGANALFYVRRADTGVHSVSVPMPAEGVWTHVALRWTAATGTPEIIIDGVPAPGLPGGSSSIGASGVMTLGARTDGAQPFPGALDDFAIWSGARSLEQLRAERVSTCVPRAGLQAKYDFDLGLPGGDNAGLTTLPDDAGGNPGTLLNFALDGPASNWIASPIVRTQPALIFDPPLEGLATGEDGSGYAGSVRLAVPPVMPVTVSLMTDAASEAVAAPAALEFTPGNWDQPQAVTIDGVDDGQPDGAAAFVFTATSASEDPCQDGLQVSQPGSNAGSVAGTLAIGDVLQAEADGVSTFEFSVTYAGTAAPAFQAGYATQDGSAAAGTDYLAATGTLDFSGTPGESRTIAVSVVGNLIAQQDRQFSVQLGAPSQAGIVLDPGSAQGTIVDDDVDLRLTLDDGVDVVEVGQTVAYDLVVANLSPTLDAGVVPLNFVAVPLQDVVWSCVPGGGASCEGGAGAFAAQPTLPAGAQANYTVTGIVAPTLGTAGGPTHLVATATAMLAIDSQPGDNTAVDVDLATGLFADGFESEDPQ